MPVAPADLVLYASLNRPQDDVSPSGGAIDATMRATPPAVLTPPGVVVFVSSSALDVQVATVLYRDVYGNLLTGTVNLAGTAPVSGGFVVQEICFVQLSAAASGTVTVSTPASGAPITTIPPTERGFTILFISAKQAASVQRFEKAFWKNVGASTLTGGGVTLTSDPQGVTTVAPAAAIDDALLVGTRETAPPGVGPYQGVGARAAVPGGTLGPGHAVGVWARQTVGAATPAAQNQFTTKVDGIT